MASTSLNAIEIIQPTISASGSSSLPSAEENSALITDLLKLSSRSPKLVRSTLYKCPAKESIQVRSWKMNEFKYYDIPSPFPTLARGLFSREIGLEEVEGKTHERHEIVIRGYDKFFNIAEVPWTSWTVLERNTTSPYTLSLKSNGCIIFIAALTPSKLLITSKHSLGPITGVQLSHARAGEAWLEKHLALKNKTKEQLAQVLHDTNWTLVSELCDDDFEEHVLAYPPEKSGLHLHGINARSKEFVTQPISVVDAFADEWGFIKTPTVVLDSIDKVRSFTDECAKTGEWNGEPVEGFVVRTTISGVPIPRTQTDNKKEEGPNDRNSNRDLSPYKQGSSFFFKVKFDEPYMMYRDWREVTKSLLILFKKNGGSGLSAGSLPKSKLKRPETKIYVKWVIDEIVKNPDNFNEYQKGKGIIETRTRFLQWLKTKEGSQELQRVKSDDDTVDQVGAAQIRNENRRDFVKTIIVPVAVPGCGKTVVAVALSHIFGFAHTQSDDVKVKKPAPHFIKNILKLLEDHDVVIADKNNHLKLHRRKLREAISSSSPPIRLLALHWSLDSYPPSMAHRICTDRILKRGGNHQHLIPDPSGACLHEDILWRFIKEAEELTSDEVDVCVDMRLEDTLEENVRRAVKGISAILGLDEPDGETITKALEKANTYEPPSKATSIPTTGSSSSKKAKAESSYFGLLPEIDLKDCLDQNLERDAMGADGFPVPDEITCLWRELKQTGRNFDRPHVTIVHSSDGDKELWDRCDKMIMTTPSGLAPLFKGKLGTVITDGRILCVTVEGLETAEVSSEAGDKPQDCPELPHMGKEFIDLLPAEVRYRLHITIGTRAADAAPVEARALAKRWKDGDRSGLWGVELQGPVEFVGTLKALRW